MGYIINMNTVKTLTSSVYPDLKITLNLEADMHGNKYYTPEYSDNLGYSNLSTGPFELTESDTQILSQIEAKYSFFIKNLDSRANNLKFAVKLYGKSNVNTLKELGLLTSIHKANTGSMYIAVKGGSIRVSDHMANPHNGVVVATFKTLKAALKHIKANKEAVCL